jgi:hypothetical protein
LQENKTTAMSSVANSTASISNVIQLLPALRALEQHEKLYIIQFLAAELNSERLLLVPGGEYPVWSPIGATSAANKLLELLEKEKEVKP